MYWKSVINAVTHNNYSWYYAKPGHHFLLWLFSLPFGLELFVPLLTSLIFGLSTLGVIYFLGRSMFSHEVGLAAAAFLAISPWHFAYSRMSGSQANAIFFWSLSLYFYWRSRPEGISGSESIHYAQTANHYYFRMLFYAGLFMGYAFTCHYNLGLMPLIFFLFEIHFFLKFFSGFVENKTCNLVSNIQPFPYQIKRIFILFMSMLLPLVFFNFLHIYLTYLDIETVDIDPGKYTLVFSYFEQIAIQLMTSTSQIWGTPSNAQFWFKLLWNNNGSIAFFVILAGFCWRLNKLYFHRDIRDLILVLPIITNLVFLINSTYTARGRSFSSGIPLMAIISAVMLVALLKEKKWKPLFFAIPFFVLLNNLPVYVNHIKINDPKNQIKEFLRVKKIDQITVQGSSPQYYLMDVPMKKVIFSPSLKWTQKQIEVGQKSGQKIEPEYLLSKFYPSDLIASYQCKPLAVWPIQERGALIDFEIGKVERNWSIKTTSDSAQKIGIFAVNDCFRNK